ncbi:MAG: CPBP family intramembrane metalloprotease [Synechococcales cyanobacterium RU_4_20]|nr:CPBP family intramembrane metalloprotease [Synechococcales cyanobacterium RU_4_20]NJR69729.1 CPBP family intramembrane metalloprotease [Synechococcales cyanobacterium CRU_2_2]
MLDRWFRTLAQCPALVRLLGFLLTLALLWLPFLLVLSWAIADSNWRSIATLVLLYLGFIGLVQQWGQIVHGEPRVLVAFGLRGGARQFFTEQLLGLWLGAMLVLVMFGVEAAMGWAQWVVPQAGFLRIAIEGLLVGLGIGFAEELLFRGWMWDELSRDWRFPSTLIGTAQIYAVLHFLKPWNEILRTWPQFLGLVLLGILLGYAKSATRGRLGLPMGLHGGLVWGYYLVNVGQLSQRSQPMGASLAGSGIAQGQVPDWVTGIDGNPLAGLVGLGFLMAAIALFAQLHRWTRQRV